MSEITKIAREMKTWWSNEGTDTTVQDALDKIIEIDLCRSWILAKDKQPAINGWYITVVDGEICGQKDLCVGMSEYRFGKWVSGGDVDETGLTYAWMPLPEPPVLKKQNNSEWKEIIMDVINRRKNDMQNTCGETENNEELRHDPVNHPSHYTDGGIETIDYIVAKNMDFFLGQVCKYISRAGKKDPAKELEDLRKAQFYLNRKIEMMERANNDV